MKEGVSVTVMVDDNGQMTYIDSKDVPNFDGVGKKTVERASNVLPLHPPKRIAFILLRGVFGDKGRVADWTRAWEGPHIVEIIKDQVVLGPFKDRATALEREVEYLTRTRF